MPSKVIENQGASLGRLAMKDRFPAMVRISERTSEIRTHANGGSGRVGVKGQDERQSTAPLTPPRPLREPARSFCLTAEEAVIHGAPRVSSSQETGWKTRKTRWPRVELCALPPIAKGAMDGAPRVSSSCGFRKCQNLVVIQQVNVEPPSICR